MQMNLLATLLRQASTSLPSPPPDAEPDMARLIAVLERNGERSVSELVEVIDKTWPTPKVATGKKRKASPAVPFDPSAWVSKLRQARNDARMFQSLLQELTQSKQLKTAEVIAIANGFRSTSKSYRSRSAAVEDVQKAWLERQRDLEKVRAAGRIF